MKLFNLINISIIFFCIIKIVIADNLELQNPNFGDDELSNVGWGDSQTSNFFSIIENSVVEIFIILSILLFFILALNKRKKQKKDIISQQDLVNE
jgi:hypothetical protein